MTSETTPRSRCAVRCGLTLGASTPRAASYLLFLIVLFRGPYTGCNHKCTFSPTCSISWLELSW